MSFISGTVGGIMGSQAQKDANRKNARTAKQANQTNFILNLAARGGAIPAGGIPGLKIPEGVAGKEAALLPYYFDDRERALAEASGEVFDATGELLGTPLEQGQRAQGIVNQYLPILDQARGTVAGIYDNSLTEEELEFNRPVAESRIKLAGARRDAGLDALQETLNSIKAIQARKGFTGDSLASQRLGFDARRKVYGDAAVDMSSAELQNAMEARSTRQSGINRKLASLNLPTALAQSRLNLEEQPAEQVSASFNRRLQPFQFFRMGQNNFQAQALPKVDPVASPWQTVANSTAATGQAVGNYFLGGSYFNPSASNSSGSPYFTKQANYGADPATRTPTQWSNFEAAQNYYGGNDPSFSWGGDASSGAGVDWSHADW